MTEDKPIELLRLLASRLERLSVDSRWARLANGLRGNILKVLKQADSGRPVTSRRVKLLTDTSFDILRQAAHDIPDSEDFSRN